MSGKPGLVPDKLQVGSRILLREGEKAMWLFGSS